MTTSNTDGLAYRLEGYTLPEGWKVIKAFEPAKDATGGQFSVGYIVESSSSGRKGFLKALDYSKAFKSKDPVRTMQAMSSAFMFERQVLDHIKQKHLDRVVHAITHGNLTVQGEPYPVDYLIFELADSDIRKYRELSGNFDVAWNLRTLHNITVGLSQLHTYNIAHQDLKPSNVLVYDREGSKIADMGRAALKGTFPPHEDLDIAGDLGYSPPELLYGYIHPDWNTRRLGCDAYLLGSMVLFLFMDIGMTAALRYELNPSHYHENWGGTFHEALPYIKAAFEIVIKRFSDDIHKLLRPDLPIILRELCEPNPLLRCCHKGKVQANNNYSLQRYVSSFDNMAKKAELKMWRFD